MASLPSSSVKRLCSFLDNNYPRSYIDVYLKNYLYKTHDGSIDSVLWIPVPAAVTVYVVRYIIDNRGVRH